MLIWLGASALLAACHGSKPGRLSVAEQRKLIDRYCIDCHSVKDHAGGLTLEGADLAQVARDAETWEKVIRKLRAGMMPPPGEPRPDFAAEQALRASLEDAIDSSVERLAGTRSAQRLSRVEYARAVHDLLDLNVDGSAPIAAGHRVGKLRRGRRRRLVIAGRHGRVSQGRRYGRDTRARRANAAASR